MTELEAAYSVIRMLLAEDCQWKWDADVGGTRAPAEFSQRHLPPNRRTKERTATPEEVRAVYTAVGWDPPD